MQVIEAKPLTTSAKIAIVVSRFNEDITQALLEGAIARLREREFPETNITVAYVPGAVEIPVAAKCFANTKQYDAIITFGAVIQGETKHFDYVCSQVTEGNQKIAIENNIPVIFGVLTTLTKEQALARAGGGDGHMGFEAADAALEMISVLSQIGG